MNRRTLLSILPFAVALAHPRRLIGATSSENGSKPNPIRLQFLEVQSKAEFWHGLNQWAEALPYLRQVWELAQRYGTVEEKAEILCHLRHCEAELAGAEWMIQEIRNNSSRGRSWGDCQTLAFYLQKIGSHQDVLEICRKGLRRFWRMRPYARVELLKRAAFSHYCLREHAQALGLLCQVPKDTHPRSGGPPYLLAYKILYVCALCSVSQAECAVQEYVNCHGRLPSYCRLALREIGIDADLAYLQGKSRRLYPTDPSCNSTATAPGMP